VSSGFTGESTEFIVTNLGNYGCLACGYPVYSLQEDGPRCDGCRRFVLKDERAHLTEDISIARAQAVNAAFESAFDDPGSPEEAGLRARFADLPFSIEPLPSEPLTMRKLDAAMDALSWPSPPEPEPLTSDRIAALVAPTLHELAQLLWAEKARLDGLVREKAMSPAVAREHLYQLREAARKRLAGRLPTPPRHQPTADPSSHPDHWSPPAGEQPPSPSELNAADVLAAVEQIIRNAKG
jgi:hypothetical protein